MNTSIQTFIPAADPVPAPIVPATPIAERQTRLMYSAADTLLTATQLAQVPTPAPLGAFHRPVPFGDFIDLIKHRLAHAGITIHADEYALAPDGATFFGAMEIGVDGFTRNDMALTLGVRGSHAQKIPRAICLGTRVIVCSNLCFNGDLANLSTKQTLNIMDRLPGMVDQAVARLPQLAAHETVRHDTYQRFELKPRHGDAALVELTRQGALTSAQLGRAIQEWDEPSYAEHAENGFTAWRLMQAVTQANKPTGSTCNMDTVRERTSKAVSWLDDVTGVTF